MKLSFEIDRDSHIPVYHQLEEHIRLLIHEGLLSPGDPLPTTRALAVELGINANTVARVYRDLKGDGLLRLERGVGTSVAPGAIKPMRKRAVTEIEKKVKQLVRAARSAEMSVDETAQLVRVIWKETLNG